MPKWNPITWTFYQIIIVISPSCIINNMCWSGDTDSGRPSVAAKSFRWSWKDNSDDRLKSGCLISDNLLMTQWSSTSAISQPCIFISSHDEPIKLSLKNRKSTSPCIPMSTDSNTECFIRPIDIVESPTETLTRVHNRKVLQFFGPDQNTKYLFRFGCFWQCSFLKSPRMCQKSHMCEKMIGQNRLGVGLTL